jgi:hypothetical protein
MPYTCICKDIVGDRPRGSPCFPLAGDKVGNASIGSLHLFGHFPLLCKYSLKRSPILFGRGRQRYFEV